ncbi:MAG: hypothetical protein HC936_13505 [Leptolyngbyaceae cyanobacterium SU_3_3]|nr:hypothetical protein [Leptolyngbyaceae cyanobacterium SU_3_3]NJR52211.1 hypothetical protein [Leptolyngbyaceae cyanobacterium CSU_1_3]
MGTPNILTQRIVSADRRTVAEAKSTAIAPDDPAYTTHQTVAVTIYTNGGSASSSSSVTAKT